MEAPVSVSLGVVQSLPAKLERLLSPEVHRGLDKGEKNNIRLLKDQLQELMDKYLMEPSEVETPTSTARCWVKEVRELSYDIDDFLDELVHGLQAAAAAAQHQKNLRGKIARLRDGLSRSRWVADETSRFRARLEEAIQRHKRYNLGRNQIRLVGIDSDESPIPRLSGVKAARLVGIDSSMEKLTEWLIGDGEPQLRVVSIVGFGGVGKTTLAKELYCKLGKQFDCRAFARSSQKPDIRRLLSSILLQVRRRQPLNDSELRNQTEIIRAQLQHKKYFIIIDDLWASSTWDVIHQSFPDDKCCSRILITTENAVAAQRCCGHNSEHIFKMGPLKDNESRKLFFSIAPSNQSENHEQFNEVSYGIIRKCGGFPLAAVTIAGLLAIQLNGSEQCSNDIRSLSFNLRTNPTIEGMKELLFFCYNNLPERLKACMLYLSIYKEDHVIWKDDLVKQWITEGFICVNEGKDMEEVARSYFDELVSAGMIQPVDVKYNGEVISCIVHYMILNIIRYKSIEENFVTAIDHTQTNLRLADKVRRLSLHFEDAAQPENLRLLQVRSLDFFGLLKSLPSTEDFRLLRVLILHLWGDQDNKSFNLPTVKLFRLRYLQIACNVTLNIQNQMQGLQYLETLKIDSRVNEVPLDIVHLPGLLHLSLPSDTILPNGIGCMASLQTLRCFDLCRNSEDNVLSLGQLTNMRDLHLACSVTSDNLVKKLQLLGSVLSKLSNLKSLTLLPAGSSNNANTLETCTSGKNIYCDFGSMSSSPALLQKLELLPRVCIFSILPKWIGNLRLLRILKIEIVALFTEDVNILKGLPVLTDLSLYVHTAPAQRIIFDNGGFSVLKNLKFICAAPFITFMEGALPTVQRLKIGFNADTMQQFSLMYVGFKHLTGLEVFFAKIRGAGPDEASREATKLLMEEAFAHHPSPPVINIQWLDFIFDRDTEKGDDSRIILPLGPSSHMNDPESSSLVPQKPGEEDKKTWTREENYQIMEEQDVIVEHHAEEPHRVLVNESGEVTTKAVTWTSVASSSHMPKSDRKPWPWHVLRSKYTRITGTGSKSSSNNETDTNTFGTKTSGSSSSVPSTPWTETETLVSSNLRKFTLSELKVSTRNFRPECLLGEGGFGSVFKGWMDERTLAPVKAGAGMIVAVKRLNLDSCQGHREWLAEVNYLGKLSHPNIVKLIGYCLEDEQRLLVYEFMARGSLANLLFRRGSHLPLPWNLRMKAVLDAGRGLAFLHSDNANIIHRDFKTSVILLDSDYNAKLSDFGLSRDGPSSDKSHVSTRVMGTYGYAAPEYLQTGHLTAKCDVYSYGVVLLELLTGQCAIDKTLPTGQKNFVEWARPYMRNKRKFIHVMDSRLDGHYSLHAAQKAADLALQCLSMDATRRPSMHEVVAQLEGLQGAKGALKAANNASW